MDHGLSQSLAERLDAAIADNAEAAFDLLERLVREPSVLGAESGAERVLAEELSGLGFEVSELPLSDAIADDPAAGVPSVPAGGRHVLVGTLAGTGSGAGRSLLVNGHLDVVPSGDPQLWRHPPFAPVREDGWMFGRGAGDMKAGWAMAMLAVRAMLGTGARPSADLLAVGAIEEECTGNGTLTSIRSGVVADAVLLPEPTALDLLLSGVGVLWVEIVLHGRQGHAESTPQGVNAIDATWTVIGALRRLADRFNRGLPEPRYHVNVGIVQAGEWPSTVPGSARLGVRIGFPPELRPDDAEAAVRAAVADAAESDPWLAGHPPLVSLSGFRAEGYELDPEAELVRSVAAAHEAAHGERPGVVGTNGTTDARFYLNQAGVPALCYGPRVEDMHGVDERVELESVVAGARTVARFMAAWLGLEEAAP
jgi:acetylornithine deacetylase